MTGCKFTSHTEPRTVIGRHDTDCEDETCRGCQPCVERHCRVCGIEHTDGTCGGCLFDTRDALAEIKRMCGDLPEEAEARGVNGEAMNLLGPVADAEARQHWEASVLAGRLVPVDCDARELDDVRRWLEVASHELHPLIVIGGWAIVYRDAFEHDEPVGRVNVINEASYLDRNLTYMGDFEHVPFEDFAHDLRRCVGHLQAVLHDQDHGERANVACFDCGADLERRLGIKGFDDAWTCRGRGCGRRYTIAEYNFALRAALEESA